MKFLIRALLLLAFSISISCQSTEVVEDVIGYCLNEYSIQEADWEDFIQEGGKSTEDMYCVAYCVLMINGIVDQNGNLIAAAEANLGPENYAEFEACKNQAGDTSCQKATNILSCVAKNFA